MLSSSRGQANFQGLEASRPRPRTWPSRPRPRTSKCSQDLEKGGAILKEWEVCKRPWLEFSLTLNQFQTVCQNLRRNVSKRSKNFPPKIRWSPKKKKKKKKKRSSPKFRVIFPPKSKIQTFFSHKIKWSPKKKKKKKKKKGLRRSSRRFFFQNFATSNVSGGALFAWGGLFSIFHRKSASKAQKTCDFAYFTSQWGGLEPPPPPPWLRYCSRPRTSSRAPPLLFSLLVQNSVSKNLRRAAVNEDSCDRVRRAHSLGYSQVSNHYSLPICRYNYTMMSQSEV